MITNPCNTKAIRKFWRPVNGGVKISMTGPIIIPQWKSNLGPNVINHPV